MSRSRTGRAGVAALAAAVVAGVLLPGADAQQAEGPVGDAGTRPVLFVANNWDGTADIIDPSSFQKLGRFNVVPDLQERLAEIYTNPVRLGYFLAIRQFVGEGHDQFADDMFSSPDGREVYVSRPSLADVVAIDLRTNAIRWRFPMEGQRADHMAISNDVRRVLVSDSTANKVHEIDVSTGKGVGSFPSGDTPHENNYSRDGSRIFHASIGLVYTPLDRPEFDSTKGDRWFQVVEAGTNRVLERLDIGRILAENGHPGYSSAVRPMAISPDERTFYLQLSFLHGFVVFDLPSKKPVRIVDLPVAEHAKDIPREDYVLDSAHHGISINPDGTKLCVAGTMSDYGAIVSTRTFAHRIHQFEVGAKPYWSTNSGDGRHCFVSISGHDKVAVLDYATEEQVAEVSVGDHPQRMRMGPIRSDYVAGLRSARSRRRRAYAGLQVAGAAVRRGRLELRLRISARATGALSVVYRAGGRTTAFLRRVPQRRRSPVRWTIRRRLPPTSGSARTGVLDVRFPGNAAVAPDRVRLVVARRGPRLRVRRASISRDGRLTVAGTVARRARGRVRARVEYRGGGMGVRSLHFRGRIRNGRWRIGGLLPSQARRGGRLTVDYFGDARRGIRGARLARAVGGR